VVSSVVSLFRPLPARLTVCALLALFSACSSASEPDGATESVVTAPDQRGLLAPITPEDRAPIPERVNGLNQVPPVPTEGRFEEFEALRATYLIPEDPELAGVNVRVAARAFGAMLLGSLREPAPSALNLDLPGHPVPVALPASLNMLGRASLYQREAATGVDVGPSKPASDGRVWVAVFQGASGPIGAVVPVCVGVTMRSDGAVVVIELFEVPARLQRQPVSREDFPVVLCEVDLQTPPDDGFVPAA